MIDNSKKPKSWWAPAVALFGEVSGWIIVPIVIALIFGRMLDAHYGTRPIFFLLLAGLGFLFSCFGIVRVIGKYMREIKKIAEEKPKKD